MGRSVKLRDRYTGDYVRLDRLRKAIEIDERQPLDWREKTMASIDELMKLLATANV